MPDDAAVVPAMLEHARALYARGAWTLERFQAEVDELYATGMADHRAPSWAGPFDLPVATHPARPASYRYESSCTADHGTAAVAARPRRRCSISSASPGP